MHRVGRRRRAVHVPGDGRDLKVAENAAAIAQHAPSGQRQWEVVSARAVTVMRAAGEGLMMPVSV